MKKQIKKRIIKATCSKSCAAALERLDHELSEYELLQLVQFAPDYETKLQVLRLIESEATDQTVKELAGNILSNFERKLEYFLKEDKDTLYEIRYEISDEEYKITRSESFLAKNYPVAIKKFFLLLKQIDNNEKIVDLAISKFSIAKIDCDKSVHEEWLASATFGRDFKLDDLTSVHIDETIEFEEIPLPRKCLDNCDIAKFWYWSRCTYCVVLNEPVSEFSDECEITAYVIELDPEKFCVNKIKSKKSFYDVTFWSHSHVSYAALEKVEQADAPPEILKAYQTFIELNSKYKKYLI